MRYVVEKNIIQVIGYLWMPNNVLCAQEKVLNSYDMSNIEDITDRDSVEQWVMLHSGDFSQIVDFRADFDYCGKHIEHDWSDPDSEYSYCDAMYPRED